MRNLIDGKFTVRDILRDEAEALSKHSPLRGEPREPLCVLDPFTRLRDSGAGACRVMRWPDEDDPYVWGCRNESLLLDEPIDSPAQWEIENNKLRHRFRYLFASIEYTDINFGLTVCKDGYEREMLYPLEKILSRVTPLAFVFIIQLWHRNPEHRSHPDYDVAFEALHYAYVREMRTTERTSSQSHGIAVTVPRTPSTLFIGTVQHTGFAERIHTTDECGCRTADDVLSSILNGGAYQDTNSLFTKFGLRNDWQAAAVGHIIQMSHVASLCTSQMGLATSIWGYLRFFIQVDSGDGAPPVLYISKNKAAGLGCSDGSRKDSSSNFNLLCHIYYFVVLTILKTHGPCILPPDLRESPHLANLFFSVPNKRPNVFSRCCSLSRLALRRTWDLLHCISFTILAALWEWTLCYRGSRVIESVGYLRIELINGKLERISGDGRIRGSRCLYLRFDSWDIRDVTEIGINRRAGLVLKVFRADWMFESELKAYMMLREAGVQFIPELLAIFNVPGTKGAMLLTMVGDSLTEETDWRELSSADRRHLGEVIRSIHTANVHHHDLREGNIARGLDGRLRIIDFGHSSNADECVCDTEWPGCPDQRFLDFL